MGLRELAERSSLTDWLIAAFTFVLAAAGIYQFIILDGQLDVMRNGERAWINRVGYRNTFEIGKPIATNVVFENTGKTAAKEVEAVFKLEILNATDEPTFDYSNYPLTVGWSGHAIFPNMPIPMSITSLVEVPGTRTVQPTILTQDLADKYKSGKIWYCIEGRISYKDIFKRRHWVTVCYANNFEAQGLSTDPPGRKACAQYNNTDD